MKTEVFVDFFLLRLKAFLSEMKEVSVNDILLLPRGFNLAALYEKRGGEIGLVAPELRTMVSVLAEDASGKELDDFLRGLAAAIKFLDLKVDFSQEAPFTVHGEGRMEATGQKAPAGDDRLLSPKMQACGRAYQVFYPGSAGESLVKALLRSMIMYPKATAWTEIMQAAVKKAKEKIKVTSSDFYNFRIHPGLKDLLSSQAGLED